MVMPIQFRFDREVDNDFVNELMSTACESGAIEYWANPDCDRFGEFTDRDGADMLAIRIKVEDEPVPGHSVQQTIDGQILHAGITRLLTGQVHLDEVSLGRLLYGVINNDATEVQGDLVDSIVQAGLYNDIVFG